jgi:CheY-like chemotaxis protein
VLLLDFAMPEMDGAQVATAAKALRPALPIVFLTGYADESLLDRVRSLGSPVIRKPFRLETLAATLASIERDAEAVGARQ